MAKAVLVQISDQPTPEIVHRFRNFGEDVYRALRNSCDIDLDEIDASTGSFHVRGIKARQVGQVVMLIKSELRAHNFSETGSVTRL